MSVEIVSYACPTEAWTESLPAERGFREDRFEYRYERGCFAEAIRRGDARLLVEHKGDAVATVADGTLRVWEELDGDEPGLHFAATLDDTPLGRYVADGIRLGIVRHICCHSWTRSHERRDDPTVERLNISTVRRVEPALLFYTVPHFSQTWVRVI
jgi:hypothetical protein